MLFLEDRTEERNDKNQLHSFDGKPAVIKYNGDKGWYRKGKLHRLDGPAVEYVDGGKIWCRKGKLHRLDGPALEHSDGSKGWWYKGKKIECSSTEEFLEKIGIKIFF